jgi:hypothetical protein
MASIASIMDNAQDALGNGDLDAFQQAMDLLADRKRMNADQRETYKMLLQAYEEWNDEGDTEEDEDALSGMSSQLAKYRGGYVMTISCSGGKSLSNGDDLAQHLEGKPLDYVLSMADQWTPIKDGTPHATKYAKLNPGQRRMNAGNKLRAAIKKGAIVVTKNGIEAGNTGE